ncbi:MAG: HlyD family efflux transporter periplasmic adaptor subunit [Muribaculaceae bacterium]|nr:HlyD family efflux transporter periplasmic adaptor subunit [Muribaculaceae bacterium]
MDREISKEEISRRKRRKWMIAGGAAAGFAALLYAISGFAGKTIKSTELIVCTADTGTIESTISATGKVVPAYEEIITSPISTRILEVYCKAGDSVQAGTPLLQLDLKSAENSLGKLIDEIEMKRHLLEQQRLNNATQLSDLEMQIKVKAMTVDRLEVELRNEQYLDSLGSGTGDRVKQVELAYRTGVLELEQMRERLDNERKVADADLKVKSLELNIGGKNLDEMRRTLEDAKIRAPKAATLTFIADQMGQKVAEGEKIAIVADLAHFKVDAEAADAFADRLRVGNGAIVKIGNEQLRGTISNVKPQSANGVMTFSVKLNDDGNKRLRAGHKTEVYVLSDVIENTTRISNGSYYTGPGEYDMFVVDGEDKLVRRKVRLGDSNYEFVEVLSGLNPGERVAVNDMKEYKNNQTIKISK